MSLTGDRPLLARLTQRSVEIVRWVEIVRAFLLLAVILVVIGASVAETRLASWGDVAAYEGLIGRVLLIVIGLELVRMLLVHSLVAILELLAFAIARKMLKLDISAVDLLLSTLGFIALIVARSLLVTRNREEAAPVAGGA